MRALLEARGITRRFGSFTALDQVNFTLEPGEIHALLGENGAGKSTLMNVLSGLLRPSAGELFLDEKVVRFSSPADAAAAGIGMVHQHFLLVPPLTVAENLLLSADRGKGGPLSYPLRSVLEEAQAIAKRLDWEIPWEATAGSLPVGTQQRIEILKALRGETRVLIFDEPTAVLTPTETPELFETIRRLAREGRGIVFISHKLDEVLALSQRVTVLRRGKVVAERRTSECDASSLALDMVGEGSEAQAMLQKPLPPLAPSLTPQPSQARGTEARGKLVVAGLTLGKLTELSFSVASGEILGVAGVDGNGQTELADCLSGMRRPRAGTIEVEGVPLEPTPRAVHEAGIGVIPADRQKRGLALPLSITENLTLGVQDSPEFRQGPLLKRKALRARAEALIERFDIRSEGPNTPAVSLSGGNQQKVVIARALSSEPKVVVAVNPTRGLDVGAIAYVHDALRQAQAAGVAILLISTELEEILALSDRVAVLFEGKLMGIVAPDTSRETLGRLMGGIA